MFSSLEFTIPSDANRESTVCEFFFLFDFVDSTNKTEVCITVVPGGTGESQSEEEGAIGFVGDWINMVHFIEGDESFIDSFSFRVELIIEIGWSYCWMTGQLY